MRSILGSTPTWPSARGARACAVAWLAAVSLGCGTEPGRSDRSLREAEALWASQGVGSYTIVVERRCFCASVEPVRIVVVNGQVTSRTFVASNQPVPATLAAAYPDVPGLFAVVRDAYQRASSVNVTFDSQYGFPRQAVIDWAAQAVDDEVTFVTSGFTRP